ncbi:MAG: helix-turn-helix domain-containing protein [Mucilaginibacter sp.]
MDVIHVPEAVAAQQKIVAGEISFVNYKDKGGPFRNRVMFSCYAFSFIQNGQKRIYRAGESRALSPGYGMLIPEGNSIITEHSDTTERYNSVLVFFPARLGKEFIAAHKRKTPGRPERPPYIHFTTNAYIDEYVRNVKNLIESQQTLSEEMAWLKVNELLTAIYEMSPGLLAGIFGTVESVPLNVVVENNLFNNLNLEELAFLANRSLSSFKRDFEKAYGVSPQRFIRDRKLEVACAELIKGISPSDLYLAYGYENLSNFNTAFKRKYGVTPGAFRQSA